jgi:hypothetical protein
MKEYILINTLSIIFFVLGSVLIPTSKAILDSCISGVWEGTIFNGSKWWGNTQNKWKNGIKAQGEKFLFSSTFFVFITDAFHYFNFTLRLGYGILCVSISMVSKGNLNFSALLYVVFFTIHTVVFHVLFTYIFKNKKIIKT